MSEETEAQRSKYPPRSPHNIKGRKSYSCQQRYESQDNSSQST